MISRRGFLAGTAVALGGPYVARAQENAPIKIGWLQALTGPNSSAGIGFNRGIEFQVKAINDSGGVGGRKIVLTSRDTQGDPTKAVNGAQELIHREKVDIILGPGNSGECLAVTPIVARAGVPQMHPGTIDKLINTEKYPNSFRVCASLQQWVEATVHYLADIRGAKTFALLGDSTAYGSVSVESSARELQKRGLKISHRSLIDLTTTNLMPNALHAQESKADAVMIWTASTGMLSRLLNARGQLKWNVPIMGHPTLGSGALGALLDKPDYWKDVYQVDFRNCCFKPDGKLPQRTADFVEKLKGKVKLDDTVLWYVAWGYDAINLCTEAVSKTNSTSAEAIIGYWNKLRSYPGVFGDYTFTVDNHNGFPTSEVVAGVSNTFRNGTHSIAKGYR